MSGALNFAAMFSLWAQNRGELGRVGAGKKPLLAPDLRLEKPHVFDVGGE